jgi:polyhydroxybutyrate depolymerase
VPLTRPEPDARKLATMDLDGRRPRRAWMVPLVVSATLATLVLGSIGAFDPAAAVGRRSSGTSRGSFVTPDGRTRTYRLHVPPSLPRHRPVPLLVALHGGFGSGHQFASSSGFDHLADEQGFIVVYPDGTPIRASGALADARVWNGGRCCGPAVAEQVDDVGFISQVITRISERHDIDSNRIYATGHSNGAIMSYRLACELSDRIVAIGVQAGSLEVDPCTPSRPVSVLHLHGGADRNIPLDGGRGVGLAGIAFRPPRDAARTFARSDGCPDTSTTSTTPDNADVSVETWQPCTDGTEVHFVTVAGASHAWMGHPSPRRASALTGEPYLRYDSSAAIWSFLAAHPRSG